MFSDERAGELMDQVMALVCSTFFDTGSGFQCRGCWPDGKNCPWFEVRVYPSVVELVGGKHDGETVYQGFRVDLRALQQALFSLYEEVQEWELDNAIGQADDLPRPSITISGKLKGGGDDTLTIHICPFPPEDAEPAEKHPIR
jgi:hypothetical protein